MENTIRSNLTTKQCCQTSNFTPFFPKAFRIWCYMAGLLARSVKQRLPKLILNEWMIEWLNGGKCQDLAHSIIHSFTNSIIQHYSPVAKMLWLFLWTYSSGYYSGFSPDSLLSVKQILPHTPLNGCKLTIKFYSWFNYFVTVLKSANNDKLNSSCNFVASTVRAKLQL